jgi:hypothetical protein
MGLSVVRVRWGWLFRWDWEWVNGAALAFRILFSPSGIGKIGNQCGGKPD